MCRSQNHSGSIKQHQKRIKQIKVKLIDSQSVIKIPERKASISQMIYNAGIIHDILLPGITSDIVKDHQIISIEIIPEHKAAACTQQQKQKAKCPHVRALTKSGQLLCCPDLWSGIIFFIHQFT